MPNADVKPKNRILIADDDADDRFLYQMAIESLGCAEAYRLDFAVDGADLLDHIHTEPELPAMVFLDLNMPHINGRECLEVIRSRYDSNQLPIVILSTGNSPTDIALTHKLGANLYIQKPTAFESILKVFEHCICEQECSLRQPDIKEFFIKAA